MTEKNTIHLCVISHTHWDREWYMSLELMKLRLVDLIDHCLDILEENPSYRFHLDAQIVVLEDYLSIRAEREQELKKYISEGRLLVGPWYLQNDFYLTSGEATVRNLLVGKKVAERFGNCQKVGYAPDQFGNISQLPQILNNFDIDNFIFGRGYAQGFKNEDGREQMLPLPLEFVWEGADESKVLAVHMALWYNNVQRFSENMEKSKKLVLRSVNAMKNRTQFPYYLLMNGVDHLEAQENLLPLLSELQQHLPDDMEIHQATLSDYIADLRSYMETHSISLTTQKGELRQGRDWSLLKGCMSSRSYLKILNVQAQERLETQLEPLYTMMEMNGMSGIYSHDHFNYLWKKLLRNHPHDSICGCSRDEVHHRMEESYASIKQTSDEMLRRGLLAAAAHVQLDQKNPEDSLIVVANTTQKSRSDTVEAELDFPIREAVSNFALYAPNGEEVPFTVLDKRQAEKDIFSPINLPGHLPVDRYRIRFTAKDMAPFSFRGYRVTKKDGALSVATNQSLICEHDQPIILENRYLKVTVNADGVVSLLHLASGRQFCNIFEWEDTADKGDSYVYHPTNCAPIYGNAFPASVSGWQNGELTTCEITRTMLLPKNYDFENQCRSTELVACETKLILSLNPDSETLQVQYEIDNRASDHRLRLLICSGILSEVSIADTPFDVISRGEDAHWFNTMSKVMPNTSFAVLEDNIGGLAVFTEGQHEYEHLKEQRALAFTVIRSTGAITRNAATDRVEGGDQWLCPENQCLRVMRGRFGLYPYQGNWVDAEIPVLAKCFRNPLLSLFAPVDTRKFAGGRPAVQDTEIQEFFYRADPWEKATLPKEQSTLDVTGKGLLVTALKLAEDGKSFVLRVANMTDSVQNGSVTQSEKLYSSTMAEQKKEYLGTGTQILQWKKKEIRTFIIDINGIDPTTIEEMTASLRLEIM